MRRAGFHYDFLQPEYNLAIQDLVDANVLLTARRYKMMLELEAMGRKIVIQRSSASRNQMVVQLDADERNFALPMSVRMPIAQPHQDVLARLVAAQSAVVSSYDYAQFDRPIDTYRCLASSSVTLKVHIQMLAEALAQ